MSTLDDIDAAAKGVQLTVFGALRAGPTDGVAGQTIVLLGPQEPGFWDGFNTSPEALDGEADPLDRWSRRVMGGLAERFAAQAVYPFGGPPYRPFIDWALRSGRTWQSPVGLLVHDTAGLMVSYRGALVLPDALDLPTPVASPCPDCDQPCRTACPAGALTPEGYDIPRCKAWLDQPEGAECLAGGCIVRRACPISQSYGRLPDQSAFHMRAFHR